jgi:hypothetical protein
MMPWDPQQIIAQETFLVHVLLTTVKVSFLRPVGDKPIARE